MEKRIELVRFLEKIAYCEYRYDELYNFKLCSNNEFNIGDIYLGRVKSVSKNINAAFVEIKVGVMCYLALNDSDNLVEIKESDEILVQIVGEANKSKLMKVSDNISLSGRYCVVTSQKKGVGYSNKLSRDIKHKISETNFLARDRKYGVIVRTNACELKDYSLLNEEIIKLEEQMDIMIANKSTRTCYSCFRKNTPSFLESIGNIACDDTFIRTDDIDIYNAIVEIKKEYFESKNIEVVYYEDDYSLSKLLSLEKIVSELTDRRVWLKSGGNIVIEVTEALTVIDVNTAKSTNNKSKDENILKVNIEASKEAMRQIRLRNISGIIIIDLINMKDEKDKADILEILKKESNKDSVTTKVLGYTRLGLVEIARKKLYKNIMEII